MSLSSWNFLKANSNQSSDIRAANWSWINFCGLNVLFIRELKRPYSTSVRKPQNEFCSTKRNIHKKHTKLFLLNFSIFVPAKYKKQDEGDDQNSSKDHHSYFNSIKIVAFIDAFNCRLEV